jgi:nucleoid-associated protein YgaU
MADMLVAKASAVIFRNGRRTVITKDKTILSADDPLVEGREQLFRPVKVTRSTASAVETATAAPGERRSTRRPQPAAPKPAEPPAEPKVVEKPKAAAEKPKAAAGKSDAE